MPDPCIPSGFPGGLYQIIHRSVTVGRHKNWQIDQAIPVRDEMI